MTPHPSHPLLPRRTVVGPQIQARDAAVQRPRGQVRPPVAQPGHRRGRGGQPRAAAVPRGLGRDRPRGRQPGQRRASPGTHVRSACTPTAAASSWLLRDYAGMCSTCPRPLRVMTPDQHSASARVRFIIASLGASRRDVPGPCPCPRRDGDGDGDGGPARSNGGRGQRPGGLHGRALPKRARAGALPPPAPSLVAPAWPPAPRGKDRSAHLPRSLCLTL